MCCTLVFHRLLLGIEPCQRLPDGYKLELSHVDTSHLGDNTKFLKLSDEEIHKAVASVMEVNNSMSSASASSTSEQQHTTSDNDATNLVEEQHKKPTSKLAPENSPVSSDSGTIPHNETAKSEAPSIPIPDKIKVDSTSRPGASAFTPATFARTRIFDGEPMPAREKFARRYYSLTFENQNNAAGLFENLVSDRACFFICVCVCVFISSCH